MGRSYNLDTEAAKQANTGGKRITDSGAYAGTLKAAFYEQNERGTESVNLMFVSDAGQEIGPLAIYTHNGEGKELPGYNAFNALLTCARIKAVSTSDGSVELYDYDSQKVVTKQKEVYPMLTDKPIGLLLRREEYENRNGEVKERMVLAGSYEPATSLMAGEILARKTEPHDLERMVSWLDANPVKELKGKRPQAATTAPANNDFDDNDFDF